MFGVDLGSDVAATSANADDAADEQEPEQAAWNTFENELEQSSEIGEEAAALDDSETLDEESALDDGADADSQDDSEAEFDAHDADSVAAYMERLLERARQSSGQGGQPVQHHHRSTRSKKSLAPSQPPKPEPAPEEVQPQSMEDGVDELAQDPLEAGPRHLQDKDAVRAKLASMREVANLSARSAIARHSWRRTRGMLMVKIILTVISLGCALLLASAEMLGTQSYRPLSWGAALIGVVMIFELVRAAIIAQRMQSLNKGLSERMGDDLSNRLAQLDNSDDGQQEPAEESIVQTTEPQ